MSYWRNDNRLTFPGLGEEEGRVSATEGPVDNARGPVDTRSPRARAADG